MTEVSIARHACRFTRHIAMSSPTQQPEIGRALPSRRRMRWPIHLQLLVPMVSVVLLASFLATAITAFWIALRVRTEQRESLRRVVKTLGEAAFPLTENVLGQMSGLSGAEFVLMTPAGPAPGEHAAGGAGRAGGTRRIAHTRASDDARETVILLGDRNYLVDFVGISRRSHFAEPATLFILYPEDELTSRIRQAVYPALMAGVVAAAVAVAIATWLARRFVRPIHTLGGADGGHRARRFHADAGRPPQRRAARPGASRSTA